jgi:pyrroline-5-carboxylate reductase
MTTLARIRLLICLLWLPDEALVTLAFSPRQAKILRRAGALPSSQNDDRDRPALSIGFLGCGTIASAIATGLAKQSVVKVDSIIVTRRSEQKSGALHTKFPNLVTVGDSNQEVVDNADIIFLTVLPKQTSTVLQELNFESRHTLISLVSTSKLDSLSTDSKLPGQSVYKMICLPAVAYNEGVCLLQSPKVSNPNHQHSILLQLLETLGGVILAADDRQMSAMIVPSGLMGSFYGMLRNNRDWLVQHAGLPKAQASYLVTRYYHGMMQDAVRQAGRDDALDKLIAEQTPGGLNEQALANAESLAVMDAYNKVQDAMFRRILGESDGCL